MITKEDLLEIFKPWFNSVNVGRFDSDNIGWYNEYRDFVIGIIKIRYKYIYLNIRDNMESERKRILKYYDPLTRDFHVETFTNLHTCESISIYRGSYSIPANNLNHPYHRLR